MASDDNNPTWFERIQETLTSHWFRGATGCVSGLGILLLMLTGGLPLTAMIAIGSVSTVLTLALGARSYHDAWKELRTKGRLNMDALFAISTITVLVTSITAFFIPWLPMMFESGLLIYGFRHIGIAIRSGIREKAETRGLFITTPQTVRRIVDDEEQEADLEVIAAGDQLLIERNSMLPVDCYCTEDCFIEEKIDTGQITPRLFLKGEPVLAGMWLRDKTRVFTASATAAKSNLAALDKKLKLAAAKKAPLEETSLRILNYFIPGILLVSVLSGVTISLFFPPALAIQFAVLILLSACPCTLGLIVSLAVKAGMHKAATLGAVFHTAKALQDANQIDTIVFDINGTLTQGIPQVTECETYEDYPEHTVFALCAALQEGTSHTTGQAIATHVAHYRGHFNADMAKTQPRTGVIGKINGRRYLLGNCTLMQEHGINLQGADTLPLKAGDSLVFLVENQQILARFVISDPLRHEAKDTINALKKQGKDIHLCTGADKATAERYATELDIKTIQYDQKGEGKKQYIQELQQKNHKVAMIGDAGNDLLAQAVSDFSIALCPKRKLTPFEKEIKKAANASVTGKSLLPIATAFTVSQQTVQNIRLNLHISLGYNLCSYLVPAILLLTTGFILPPAVGVALMALQACFIFTLVYQLKQQPVEHLEKFTASAQEENSHLIMHKLMPAKRLASTENAEPAATYPLHKAVDASQSCEIDTKKMGTSFT